MPRIKNSVKKSSQSDFYDSIDIGQYDLWLTGNQFVGKLSNMGQPTKLSIPIWSVNKY